MRVQFSSLGDLGMRSEPPSSGAVCSRLRLDRIEHLCYNTNQRITTWHHNVTPGVELLAPPKAHAVNDDPVEGCCRVPRPHL
jgi:hypothetical protein